MSSSAGPREFGTPTIEASVPLREPIFAITYIRPRGENSRPPYSLGMMKEKNPLSFTNSYTSCGKS